MKCRFCPEPAHFTYLQVCKQCYNGLRYWRGRSQRDKRKRAEQLTKLGKRMAHLIDKPRNVPRKRKKRGNK